MTKLELVRMLARECRLAAVPVTTVNQVGEFLQVVEDIDSAYAWIQRKAGGTWQFLVQDFAFDTTSGDGNYPTSVINLTDGDGNFLMDGLVPLMAGGAIRKWKEDSFRIYLTATGYADEDWLYYLPWPDFRDLYVKGSDRTTPGRPNYFSVKPDKSIQLYPIPNAIYTVVGEMWRSSYTMTADTDVPAWVSRDFDELIVWKALEFWGAREENPNREIFGQQKFRGIYLDLRSSELPDLEWGPPLA